MFKHHYTARAYFEGNEMAEESADYDAGSDLISAKQWAICKAQEGLLSAVYDNGQYLGEFDPEDPIVKAFPCEEPKDKYSDNADYADYQAYCNEYRAMGFKPVRFEQWLMTRDAIEA